MGLGDGGLALEMGVRVGTTATSSVPCGVAPAMLRAREWCCGGPVRIPMDGARGGRCRGMALAAGFTAGGLGLCHKVATVFSLRR